jgi:hypothetical protein
MTTLFSKNAHIFAKLFGKKNIFFLSQHRPLDYNMRLTSFLHFWSLSVSVLGKNLESVPDSLDPALKTIHNSGDEHGGQIGRIG